MSGLIKAYNATPENFGVPEASVIESVIKLVEEQISADEKNEGAKNSLLQVG